MKFLMEILKKAENSATIALSSGSDSVAVTHFLKKSYPQISLKAFHYNHNLREQNFVMQQKAIQFCEDFDVPLFIKKRDGDCEKRSEAELRECRYAAMTGLGTVITGHHLDDAVENYMYNCLNGVPEYLPMPLETVYDDFGLKIIRPFIITDKKEILEYIERHRLEKYVVEDETNADEKYRRNWLRNNLLPQIYDKGYNLKTIVRKRYMQKRG